MGMKFTGKMSKRFKAMAAIGITAAGLTMGAMAQEVHAAGTMDNTFSMDMNDGLGSTYNPITGELTMGGITHNLNEGKVTHINGVAVSPEYEHKFDIISQNRGGMQPKATVQANTKNRNYGNANIQPEDTKWNAGNTKQGTYSKSTQQNSRNSNNQYTTQDNITQALDGLLDDPVNDTQSATQNNIEQALEGLLDDQVNDTQSYKPTGNSFRDSMNSRNPDSPYYVKGLESKEKAALEKSKTAKEKDVERSYEDALEQLL